MLYVCQSRYGENNDSGMMAACRRRIRFFFEEGVEGSGASIGVWFCATMLCEKIGSAIMLQPELLSGKSWLHDEDIAETEKLPDPLAVSCCWYRDGAERRKSITAECSF
jgi:hypothetical protein